MSKWVGADVFSLKTIFQDDVVMEKTLTTSAGTTITPQSANNGDIIVGGATPAAVTGANLAGTGTSLHWFTVDVVEPFQVFPNQPIKINLTLDTTLATGTSQAGIMSIAPYLNTAKLKSFNESVISFHIHAGLGHADDIFRFNMDRVKSEAFG